MVRFLFTVLLIPVFMVGVAQKTSAENKILFSASFNKDTVPMGDSLKITLSFKNESEDTVKFCAEGRVVISHYRPDVFITDESMERTFYVLREYSNPERIIRLKPKEEFQCTFNIEAKESFFYEKVNTVSVSYRSLWDDPVEYKKRKKQQKMQKESANMLYSAPVKITVVRFSKSRTN